MNYSLATHFGANVDKHLEEMEQEKRSKMDNDTYDDRTNIKFLKQDERIEKLEDTIYDLKRTIEFMNDTITELKFDLNTKIERIDDTLVVHRNQNDTQRENHKLLIKVVDEKVIPLIKGTHGG